MKNIKYAIVASIALFANVNLFAQYTNDDIVAYIDTYKELAINKMYEYKIPASITIAQGIFESAAGKSHLAVDGNNHFGIKCHNDWTGDTILIDDDELQECFRKYAKAEDSYTDHSLFLKNRKRYSALFSLDVMDYAGWARGLKAAGYATNPEYAPRLIGLIERFNLAKLDTIYQQRLAAGYFKDYPNVHPEVMATATETKPATVTESQSPAKPSAKPTVHKEAAKNKTKEPQTKPAEQPKTTPQKTDQKNTPSTQNSTATPTQPQPSTTPQSSAKEEKSTDTETEPAETGATEEAVQEDKPTAITVFSARKTDFPVVEYPFTDRTVYENNKTYFVIAQKGDTYSKIATDVQSNVKKLKKFNDVSGNAKLKVGQVVYIEAKNKVGKLEYYKVVNAETLNYISQKNAVRLDKIYKYNNLKPGAKIKKGDVIKLKK